MKLCKIFVASVLIAALATSAGAKNEVKKVDPAIKKQLKEAWLKQAKSAQNVTKAVSIEELKKWIDKDKEFVLVDVREPKEVASGKIVAMEFMAIPRGMVAPSVGKKAALTPEQTIVFYCKFGIRSSYVAKEIQEYYGFKNVYYLKGGISAWLKSGEPIENKLGELVRVK